MKQDIYESELLYHYTKTQTLLAYILENMTLQFNLLSKTNDPLEYRAPLVLSISSGSQSKHDWDSHFEYEKKLKDEKLYYKLACFCQDDKTRMNNSINREFGKGYGKPCVWAQYGDSHKGVCVVFNKTLLESRSALSGKVLSGEIEYNNFNQELAKVEELDLDYLTLPVNSFFEDHIRHYFEKMLFCKYEDFRDESEYRIVLRKENNIPYYVNIRDSIKAVIIGENCDDEERNNVIERCNHRGISVYDINWNVRGPQLCNV